MFALIGSERDPVRAYDLYASKRPDDLKTLDSPFYLAINYTTKAINTKPWFKSAPMGVKKLKLLMKKTTEKAVLDAKNLTDHSRRKRTIQKLNDEGVWPTHIIQISGHKNIQSLNNYSTLSELQQKNIFNILSGYPGVPGPLGYQVGISSASSLNATKTVQQYFILLLNLHCW